MASDQLWSMRAPAKTLCDDFVADLNASERKCKQLIEALKAGRVTDATAAFKILTRRLSVITNQIRQQKSKASSLAKQVQAVQKFMAKTNLEGLDNFNVMARKYRYYALGKDAENNTKALNGKVTMDPNLVKKVVTKKLKTTIITQSDDSVEIPTMSQDERSVMDENKQQNVPTETSDDCQIISRAQERQNKEQKRPMSQFELSGTKFDSSSPHITEPCSNAKETDAFSSLPQLPQNNDQMQVPRYCGHGNGHRLERTSMDFALTDAHDMEGDTLSIKSYISSWGDDSRSFSKLLRLVWRFFLLVLLLCLIYAIFNATHQNFRIPIDDCKQAQQLCNRYNQCCFSSCGNTWWSIWWKTFFSSLHKSNLDGIANMEQNIDINSS